MAKGPLSRFAIRVFWLATAIFVLSAGIALAASDDGRDGSRHRAKLSDARAVGALSRCFGARARRVNPAGVRRRGCGRPAEASRSSEPLYWGATIGDHVSGEQAPWDMSAVSTFEAEAGRSASMVQFFQPFADCDPDCSFYPFPTEPVESIRAHGSIPVLSWSSQAIPSSLSEPDFQLGDVIEGRYDDFIREFAEDARDWGHPFFLRFDWEMNGFWFPWNEGVNGNTAGQYVAAWRHVHDIFTAVGATNATWVWCPNVDLYDSLTPLGKLYPGDSYVDWTGLDGFNWGRRRGSPGWQTFDQVFEHTYKRIVTRVAPAKPMMLAELASNKNGGDKPAWIEDMLATVRHDYRRIRALVWYDVEDRGTNWPIERRPADYQAFRQGIGAGAYRGNEFGAIVESPILPPPR
jgi:hypothetical protein